MKIERFEDIKASQMARELTNAIYLRTRDEDFAKDWGLKDQIQRASGSIMHNIAEGFDSGSTPEFIRFLGYAQRSATQVMSQLYLALDQNYIQTNDFDKLYVDTKSVHATIGGFIKYLKNYKRTN